MLQLQVRATSTEPSNGASASVSQAVQVHVLAGTRVATPVGLNPYVRLTAGMVSTASGAGNGNVVPALAGTVLPGQWLLERGQVSFQAVPAPPSPRTPEEEALAEQQRHAALGDAWLVELEQAARAQWRALAGPQVGG